MASKASSASVGRYLILRSLGSGGMADVYVAHDPNFDRDVVVKVIKPDYSDNADFRARFNREARVIARLEHEAIVPVYDFGEHDGQPYIVMRLMTGGTLSDRLENGPLPLADAAGLVARIARALDYAHSQGVVHRDLKPANILFDNQGAAYLSDFGIAKIAEGTVSLTGTAIIGTPAYMSPEQARAQQGLDRRSDVYSLGVMVFQLLTGELPYQAEDGFGMALAHLNEPVPDIRKVRPDLPRESETLIRRAMAKKPDDRFQTTGELAAEFNKLALKPEAGPRKWRQPGRPVTPAPPAAAAQKPKTPPPEPSPTLAADEGQTLASASAGAGTSRPVPPKARPAWLLPAIITSVLIVLALAAGGVLFSGLLTRASQKASPAPTLSAGAAVLKPGATSVSTADGMTEVFIPAGDFIMGSKYELTFPEETPQHPVYLDAYWIDRTPVTNGMYALCVKAGACRALASNGSATHANYSGAAQFKDYPVIYVDWPRAGAYCRWAGRRLPSEAEWEKAARGADGRTYPWGETPPGPALLNWSGYNHDVVQVGSYPDGASPYGVLDMAGNVWQWTADFYDAKYYAVTPRQNPTGPQTGAQRVQKGGAWLNNNIVMRSAVRRPADASLADNATGFRCALSPATSGAEPAAGGLQPLFVENFENNFTARQNEFNRWGAGGWNILQENGNSFYELTRNPGPALTGLSFGLPAWKDYAVELRVRLAEITGPDSGFGLNIRQAEPGGGEHYRFYFLPGANHVELGKDTLSGSRSLANQPFGLAAGRWYVVRLEAVGTRLAAFIDGQPVFSADDTDLSAGYAAFAAGAGARVQIDDIAVTVIGK